MQTQCPQCHTAFRVSEEQLELAAGKVRCGQCLHIFVASDHFINISDASLELEASQFELPEELFTDELSPVEIDKVDIEMPVLETYNDNGEEEMATEADSTGPLNQATADTPADTSQEASSEITATGNSPETSPEDRTPTVDNIAEAANEAYHEQELSAPETPASEVHDVIEEYSEEQLDDDTSTAPDPDETIPLLVENFDASQLYPELISAPAVERPKHTGLYSLITIALLAIFVLQGMYALRDTLAGQPVLRPLMSEFCATFDCAITLPREPEKILLTRSEVRSHPAQSGALLIKASMQNKAHFRQAYPILRLQFKDLEGNALVGRDFMPGEYLPDDVNIRAGMPINSNVNLSLELVDPGGQAVSFDFALI